MGLGPKRQKKEKRLSSAEAFRRAAALERGQIAAAAVDVLEEEPPRSGSPLIDTAQSVITPHVAWQSTEARRRLLAISVENLRAFLAGQPQNVVS